MKEQCWSRQGELFLGKGSISVLDSVLILEAFLERKMTSK